MCGCRRTFLHRPAPINTVRLLTTGAFRLLSQEEDRIQEHQVSRNPYPFEGRSQANEGDDARTKRALAEIGVGVMPRSELSKKGPGRDRSGSQNFGCWGDAIGP